MFTNTLQLGGTVISFSPIINTRKGDICGEPWLHRRIWSSIGPVDFQMQRLQTGGAFHTRFPGYRPVVCYVRDRTYSYKGAFFI